MTVGTLFEPINRAHAVVETIFFFEFSDRLLSDEASPAKLRETMSHVFPKAEAAPSMEFTFDLTTGASMQKTSDALTFSKGDEQGQAPSWLLRVNANHVSIHCMEYTRWAPVYEEAWSMMARIFEFVRPENLLNSIGLKVLDRFKYLDSRDKFDAEQLLRKDSEFLSKNIFRSLDRWHINTGWFDFFHNGKPLLNQLSIDSSGHETEGVGIENFVTIDHVVIIKNVIDGKRNPLEVRPKSEEIAASIADIYSQMHNANKSVLIDLIQPDFAKKLNLVQRAQ
ncbi:TIGR04255 family protein [Pseudomonas paracarnis]|uniref:TIGR04255 family protein n=1 Tax=Pseudomonas paracarnis TaxID=2750625 RepID=UPI003F8ECBE4